MEPSSLTSFANILVADDNLDSLRLIGTMLTDQGYQVRKVLNGQMALTAAQTSPPDLILLDVNMPQLTGYEVCRKLKEYAPTADIPVIFISALNEVLDKVRAFAVGGVDYITKPFQYEEVMSRVETHLKVRSLQHQCQKETHRADQAEQRYNRLFDYALCGMFQATPQGAYLRVNTALAHLFGYTSPTDLITQRDTLPQHPYAEPSRWVDLLEFLDASEQVQGFKSPAVQADGTFIWISETIYTVRNYQGDLVCYEGMVQAIAPPN